MARKRAYKADSRVLWNLCDECGAPLDRTVSGFLACPLGHGKLVAEEATVVGETNLWSRRCVCGADLGTEGEFCSEECRGESASCKS